MEVAVLFATFGITFGILDVVWLKSANAFYRSKVGHVMSEKPNFVAAIIFYVIYVTGVTGFALVPGVAAESIFQTVVAAGALGFLCYATYDLTNLATVKKWSTTIVVVDMLWGTVATAVAAGVTFLVMTGLGL